MQHERTSEPVVGSDILARMRRQSTTELLQGLPPSQPEANSTRGAHVLRGALRTSMNRHWLARVVLGFWALQIPLVATWAPHSASGRALAAAGAWGGVGMLVLTLLASLAILDSAINDSQLLPSPLTQFLMSQRHIGFMLLAIALVLTGGGIAVHAKAPILFVSFVIPAVFCVVVTCLDLSGRHFWRANP